MTDNSKQVLTGRTSPQNKFEGQPLTNAAGIPIPSNTVSKSVGKHGPLLLEDYTLLEKMAHFNRERIPERVVHAIGSGAYGILSISTIKDDPNLKK